VSDDRNANQLPLRNKTIAVTRGIEQAKDFSQLLEQYGAQVILFPTVEIIEPKTWSECDTAIAVMSTYAGIIFTSANAVKCFFHRAEYHLSIEQMKKCRLYVVGEKTKSEIDRYGMETEKIPETFSAEQLAQEIVRKSVAGERFLFPKGNLAKSDIETALSSHGLRVDSITIYRTQEPPFTDERKKMLKTIEEKANMITFFSPSSVAHYVLRATQQAIKNIDVAVIGQTTADAARREGMNLVLVSPHSTAEAFAKAIRNYYTT